ncbi:MAG TPA: tetratricopeptide repeat protein [Candidatus Acidoferrales bacterium]|nr:tetratricopeptide repeat protein [Candidatus Acidoferrales bacterium]
MRKGSVHLIIAAVMIVGAVSPARSQDEQLHELRIEVMAPGEGLLPKYTAELEGLRYRQKFGSAETLPDGTMRFRNVPYGEYKLSIVDGAGGPVYEQGITVGPQTSAVMIRLPNKKVTPRPLSGTVSVQQLRDPIRKKALQSFSASQKFFDAGDYEKAAGELQKAIRISPGYAEAYSTLAAVHIGMGLYDQAMSETSRALDIAGPNARDLSNMALAQYKLERYAESMQSARSALRLDPNYNPACYVLGVVLAMDKRTMPESVPYLERAAQTIGSAKAILTVVQKELGRE